VPVLPWLFLRGGAAVVASIAAGTMAAVVFGVLLARFTERPVLPSALRQLGIVALAAGVPYAIGNIVGVTVS
jgi:VIT1/CCC1 family predicted Fe2+/Mn2+ transporter